MKNPLKQLIKEPNMGMECTENIDGSKSCKRIKGKKGNIYTTGTDVVIDGDPNTCKARISGRIMDEDRASVESEARDWESKCKKGF